MKEKKYTKPDEEVYSKEELELFKSVEDEIENDIKTGKEYPELEEQKEVFSQIARNTLEKMNKKRQYSIRLVESDVEKIKSIATHKGMPYQVLISSVIHQVATKQIKV